AWERWVLEDYEWGFGYGLGTTIADAIGKIGPSAVEAIPHLLPVRVNDPHLTGAVQQAIEAMGSAAVPELTRFLGNPSGWLHFRAAVILNKFNPERARAVQELIYHGDPALSRAAREWLREHKFPRW